eukprot:g65356.t1
MAQSTAAPVPIIALNVDMELAFDLQLDGVTFESTCAPRVRDPPETTPPCHFASLNASDIRCGRCQARSNTFEVCHKFILDEQAWLRALEGAYAKMTRVVLNNPSLQPATSCLSLPSPCAHINPLDVDQMLTVLYPAGRRRVLQRMLEVGLGR